MTSDLQFSTKPNLSDPKTPKSDGSSMETCESSPEGQDQNGKKPRTIFSREQVCAVAKIFGFTLNYSQL